MRPSGIVVKSFGRVPSARWFSQAELQVLAVPGVDPQHGLLVIISVPEPNVDLLRVLRRIKFERPLVFDVAVIRKTERFAVELELMITDLFLLLARLLAVDKDPGALKLLQLRFDLGVVIGGREGPRHSGRHPRPDHHDRQRERHRPPQPGQMHGLPHFLLEICDPGGDLPLGHPLTRRDTRRGPYRRFDQPRGDRGRRLRQQAQGKQDGCRRHAAAGQPRPQQVAPRAIRVRTVPSGHPSCRATASCGSPSM